jgi:6-pyruvoyl-tetrahydropterin synthase
MRRSDEHSHDALARVDFDDLKVIAAIREAADNFDEAKYADRLQKFEPTLPTADTMMTPLP